MSGEKQTEKGTENKSVKPKKDKLSSMPKDEREKYSSAINANGDIVVDIRLIALYYVAIEADKKGILLPSSVKAFIEDDYVIEKYGNRFSGLSIPKWFNELYKERIEKGHKNITKNIRSHEILKALAFGYALTVKPIEIDDKLTHPLLELKNKSSEKGAMHVAELILELYKTDDEGVDKKTLITFKTSGVFNVNNKNRNIVGLPSLPYKNQKIDGKHKQVIVTPEDCDFDSTKLFNASKSYRVVCEALQKFFMYNKERVVDITVFFDYDTQPILNIKAIQGQGFSPVTEKALIGEDTGIKIPRIK